MEKDKTPNRIFPVREGLTALLLFLALVLIQAALGTPLVGDFYILFLIIMMSFVPAFFLESGVMVLLLKGRGYRLLPLFLAWPLINVLTFAAGGIGMQAISPLDSSRTVNTTNLVVFEAEVVLLEALILLALSRWKWIAPGKAAPLSLGRALIVSLYCNLASFSYYTLWMRVR